MDVSEWLGKDNTLGIDIWEKKYRHNNESFDEWLDRVSTFSDDNQLPYLPSKDAIDYKFLSKEIRRMILEKKFLFGGRILANRGLSGNYSLSNCYCLEVKDSIQDIYEVAKNTALTYKAGGGVGIDISNLAPAGAKVNNPAKTSSGAVSFIELFTTTTSLIGINGRRSALMVSMACDHPDIGEFINLKTDVDKATTANLSVRVSDEFMKVASKDKINDWNCMFYRMETDELISRHYNAKELFRKLCDANYDYGEPGILFWDRIKSFSIVSDYPNFKFAGVNPCVRGDTLILTDKGWKEIQSLVGTTVNVWNGQEWSEVNPRITGFNQKMLKITTSDGCSVDCTHYHKFHLADGSVIPANKLRIGDKLVKCSFPNIHESKVEFDPLMYTYGVFQGDGSRDYVRGKAFLYLYGDKKKLAEYCTDIVRYRYEDTRDIYKLTNCPAEVFSKTFIPMDGTLSQKLSWLAGYIDTDGCRNSADGGVSISSIDKDMLMKVKLMLNTLGCTGSINVMKEKGLRPMPDGKGGYADFECQRSYRLVISARNVEKLLALGLTLHRVEVAPHTNRDSQRFITITGIEDTEDADIVYCMTEPKAHRFIANGMIVGNCAETALPDGGACLLGSMNLSAYVKDGKFDIDAFARDVPTAILALNIVQIEGENHHPLAKQKETARNWRQIGLGIMGLGDMLIKTNMVYGSYESITLCDEIAEVMAKSAIHESVVLGHKLGSFEKFDEENTNKSEFIRNHTNKRITALRNAQLLSIAPTGSISTMLGVSGGIEPLYALEYTRTTKSLQGRDEEYVVCPEVVLNARKEGRTGCLVCAKDIPYENRIRMQAVWQKHVDASISSTINLPEDFDREKIWDIYFSAWEAGLKGITVFRDGCKRAGILNTKKDAPTQVVDVKAEELVGKKRKLMTGCGSLHVTAFFDKNTGDLRETFLSHGSTGGCNNFMIGLSRMVSLSARAGCSIDAIVDQLKSCGSCPSYAVRRATKGDTSLGSCCPSAVGNALVEMHEEMLRELKGDATPSPAPEEEKRIVNPCPVCGAELHFTNGCMSCTCGFSKCG